MIPCTGCHFDRAFEHLPRCPQNPFNRSVDADQEPPRVTFVPDCADRIARSLLAPIFPTLVDERDSVVAMTVDEVLGLLANAAHEGYVNGLGVAA